MSSCGGLVTRLLVVVRRRQGFVAQIILRISSGNAKNKAD
jgi:hypothetical protein